ncbi:hypothetical protein LTR17_001729 [Elasticomyces elasticus]|nr:hypothetical protein LTR17_001729 [Elasticomyces elasticus]
MAIEGARCHANVPWASLTRACSDYTAGWIAILIMDIVTELLLLAMPAWILFDLQMARRTKIIILSAFALRVPYDDPV